MRCCGAGRQSPKIRSHAYVYVTYGLLRDLTHSDVLDPRSEAELKYYVGGRNVVQKLISTVRHKFDVQVALMHYAAENATGAWEFQAPV